MSDSSRRKSFDSDTSRAIGLRIREARADRTQEEFASLIGVSRAALTNYEGGRRLPNDIILKRVADASNKSVNYLLFGNVNVNFEHIHEKINQQVLLEASKRPGYIPKFEISDDEIAFIALFRLMFDKLKQKDIIKSVIEVAELEINSNVEDLQIPVPWGAGYLEALKIAYERGYLEPGYDPIFHLYAHFFAASFFRPMGPQ